MNYVIGIYVFVLLKLDKIEHYECYKKCYESWNTSTKHNNHHYLYIYKIYVECYIMLIIFKYTTIIYG